MVHKGVYKNYLLMALIYPLMANMDGMQNLLSHSLFKIFKTNSPNREARQGDVIT